MKNISRIALSAAFIATALSNITPAFAQNLDAARKQLFDQLDRELVIVEKLGQAEVSLPSYAAWKEVVRDRTDVTGAVNVLRGNPQSSVPTLERILAAVKSDNGRAKRVSDAVKSLNDSTKRYADYAAPLRAQLVDPGIPQMAELTKRCDPLPTEIQSLKSADYPTLESTAVAVAKDATECPRFARELIALQGKGRELDALKAVVPDVAQKYPVLSQVAAFTDIVNKHGKLLQATDRLRKTATVGNALDDSIKQLQVMNIEAEGFARNAQSGGNARTVRVLNTLERDANVFWRAAGCAGVYTDQTAVCNHQPVKAGQTVEYQFKPGTSGRKVGVVGGGCTTQETSIGQDGAGADLHVITDGCQIKPESVALSESVQKRTLTVRNNRDKPIDVLFAHGFCLGLYKGIPNVCRSVTVAPGTAISYEFSLLNYMSAAFMRWGDDVCPLRLGIDGIVFLQLGKRVDVNPNRCGVSFQ